MTMDMGDVEDLSAAWAITPPTHVMLHRIAIALKIVEPKTDRAEDWKPSSAEELSRFMDEVNRSANG